MTEAYYQDPFVTIYHGDCIELWPMMPSIDVMITDPPYSEWVHAKSRAGSRVPKRDGRGRVSKASISRVVDFGFNAIDDKTRNKTASFAAEKVRRWSLIFSDLESMHLWRASGEAAGLDYVRGGIWVKIGATPQFTGDRPGIGAEAITILHPRGKKTWGGGGSLAVWSVPIALNRGGKSPRHHTTEKPLELMTKLVGLFSDPGEVIIDPFAGSGTTGRAAKDLGRRCILIEKDEEDCETAAKRMAQESLFQDLAVTPKAEQAKMF